MARWRERAKRVTLDDAPDDLAWYPGRRYDDEEWQRLRAWLAKHDLMMDYFDLVGEYGRARLLPARRKGWNEWNLLREKWGLPRVEPPEADVELMAEEE